MPLAVRKWTKHGENVVINFFQIASILAGNKDRHKISVKFNFGLNQVIHSGVTCP